jgi:hypothetical protein
MPFLGQYNLYIVGPDTISSSHTYSTGHRRHLIYFFTQNLNQKLHDLKQGRSNAPSICPPGRGLERLQLHLSLCTHSASSSSRAPSHAGNGRQQCLHRAAVGFMVSSSPLGQYWRHWCMERASASTLPIYSLTYSICCILF